MIVFDEGKSKIFRYSRLVKFLRVFIFKILSFFVYLLGICSFAFVILYNFSSLYNLNFNSRMLGLAIISLAISLFYLSFHIFYESGVKNVKPIISLKDALDIAKKNGNINLADFVSINLAIAISNALKKSEDKKNNMVNSSDLLLELLKVKSIRFIVNRTGLSVIDLEKHVEKYASGKSKGYVDLSQILEKALEVGYLEGHEIVSCGDVFVVLSVLDPLMKKILFDLNLKIEDIANIVHWETSFYKFRKEKNFDPDKIKRKGGIGREWAYGYTRALRAFGHDLTDEILRGALSFHIIGHEKDINQIEDVLVRATHHNIILVGAPGVGKRTVVLGLAKRILEGTTYSSLANKRLIELDVDRLLAGAQTPGEIIERLEAVMSDSVVAGNIVLFIDNIQKLFGSGEGKVGSIDASQVLVPFLENPNLYFVSTANSDDFHQYIETRSAVSDKFEILDIAEPNENTTLRILEDLAPKLESQGGVIMSYPALKSIYKLADQFLYSKPFPEKAIDLLNEVIVFASAFGRGTIVLPRHVETLMKKKVKAPIGEAEGAEKQLLLHLEDFLHKRVVDQEEAIKVVSNALRRARSGVEAGNKPVGSFLFLGPTGVGKTETTKALAEAYFGSEKSMIRFDMSEYQDLSGVYRLIGPPPGTPEAKAGGELTNAVKDNPFTVILFDEIEKAHKDILNLFLQMLDEGWLTDSLGRKVKFNNAMIIATSNAGANLIQEGIKQHLDPVVLKERLINYLQAEGIFRPEFLNRFTSVVYFKPLEKEHVLQITKMLLGKLVKRLEQEKGIFLRVDEPGIERLAELGFDPLMGARPIMRTIQNYVENILAKKMLTGEIKRGSEYTITLMDIDNMKQ
ncbi:MAG: ATP-dependent Clp protease ATP-binding subunit [Patescibacteria group bacterium]|nr:ATP-dependent Clp protease ATP-binding subunit [Patescibacteria group bacterium]